MELQRRTEMMNDKECILYVGGFELPDLNAAAHRVVNNAKVFINHGFEVAFCGIKRPDACDGHSKFPFEDYSVNKPSGTLAEVWHSFSITHIKHIVENKKNIRFIIAYNLHFVQLHKLVRFCKKNNIVLIGDITEWYENKFSLLPVKFYKWLDTKLVMEYLYKKLDSLIVISTYLENYYKKNVKNICVIPPLVDLQEEKWNYRANNDNTVVKFVYTGLPGKTKDRLDFIFRVFSQIKYNYELTIIGISKEKFVKDFNCNRDMDSRIVFKNRVSHSESIRALIESDYCVFFRNNSRKNNAGFPTKFAECISCGVGVVTNNYSDLCSYQNLPNVYVLNVVEEGPVKDLIEQLINKGKVSHKKVDVFSYEKWDAKLFDFLRRSKEAR